VTTLVGAADGGPDDGFGAGAPHNDRADGALAALGHVLETIASAKRSIGSR
jgi:hypothetical protein